MPTLNWVGKDKVQNHHNEVPYRMLDSKYSYGDDGDGNMIIHGDNLEALKSLLPEFEGKVGCIYIDPPYNTGNESWVYNDNVNDPRIRKWLGEVVGKEGDDLSRHDKWLCMMYPRLRLLHKLLANDGVIFISIDDNEQEYLKFLCNEIFGMNNFIAQMVWQKRTSPDARRKISAGHEYILTYVKNSNGAFEEFNKLAWDEESAKNYKNPDNDPRGPWISTDCTAQAGHGTQEQFYTMVTPMGRVIELPDNLCWRFTKSRMEEEIEAGRIWFGKDGKGVPRKKTYLYESEGRNLWTWWPNTEVGHTQEATKELTRIFGSSAIFDYPKPVRLIQRIIQIATNKNTIVLDSFAGSGTTAHAVLNANKADGGHRRFILVEMEDYADSITAERVKRVIDGYGEGKKAVEGTGGGFSFYELGERLFLDDGNINPQADVREIRKYIWFTETRNRYMNLPADGREGALSRRDGEISSSKDEDMGHLPADGREESLSKQEGGKSTSKDEGKGHLPGNESGIHLPKDENEKHLPEDGNLRNLPEDENGGHLPKDASEKYLMGVCLDTAYYLIYEKGETTALNRQFLSTVKTKAGRYVVYADICLIPENVRAKYNITFKKIPRDIARL